MFVKDFTYPPLSAVRDPGCCRELLRHATIDKGAFSRTVNLLAQVYEGDQLWVTKEVSDDLQAADLNPDEIKFEELEWPGRRLEVYFEDPAIPTFLAAIANDAERNAIIGRLTNSPSMGGGTDEEFVNLQVEDHEGSLISVTYRYNELDMFAGGDTPDHVTYTSAISVAIGDTEESDMRGLAILLFKVLLLASSEGHSIRRTRDKPTRKQGGKPGFKNRPVTDRLIVEYLPRHHVERRQAAETEGKTHKFNGRRGHWRRFHSDKFVRMKGKKIFIYPIPGPDGTVPRKKFVVRKPK